MCVDDYQFRHYSAVREKLCKRFVFCTPEGMERAYLVNISEFEIFGNLCLCQVLMHLNKKGLNIKDYRFYLHKFDVTIEAGDRCKVPFNLFTDKEIVFDMKRIEDENLNHYRRLYVNTNQVRKVNFEEENQMDEEIDEKHCIKCQSYESMIEDNESQQSDSEEQYSPGLGESLQKEDIHKRSKESEKTVEEALTKTKKWRWIHEKLNFSLKNSAIYVGLSKKTLDDYFLILRVGQFHRYDFKNNLDKKIGHLRTYIKNQPLKITGRLPKVLGAFSLIPDPDITPIKEILNAKLTKDENPEIVATASTLSANSHRGRHDEHEMIAE